MAPRGNQKGKATEEKVYRAVQTPFQTIEPTGKKPNDYTSHGVTDNDIFLLPGSDLQLLGVLTAVGAAVRLFRIYQPSSVVFDEVQ